MIKKGIREIAEEGDPDAQYKLALMYYYGNGVVVDKKLSLTWFTRAAEQGHGMAMFRLGRMYHEMEKNQANIQSTIKWLTIAAAEGIVEAAIYLGDFHVSARNGHPDNRINAYMWYKVATINGDAGSNEICQRMESELSDEELMKALAKAKAFMSSVDDKINNKPAILL